MKGRALLAALAVVVALAGCGGASYAVRSESTTTLVAAANEPVALVPPVRRGHSTMWKTGAIITFTSLGVMLAGSGMIALATLSTLDHPVDNQYAGLGIAGYLMASIGGAGGFIGGPITWMAGIGGKPE